MAEPVHHDLMARSPAVRSRPEVMPGHVPNAYSAQSATRR